MRILTTPILILILTPPRTKKSEDVLYESSTFAVVGGANMSVGGAHPSCAGHRILNIALFRRLKIEKIPAENAGPINELLRLKY